jgi:hypothetical protein
MPESAVEEYRKELVKLIVLAVPTMLVNLAVDWLKDKTTAQPWQAVWMLIPLAAAAAILWKSAKRKREMRIGGVFLGFFALYVLGFSIAAGSGVLDGKRTLIGYEQAVPRNFLSLNRLGDWHYWFARKVPEKPRMTVVTFAPAGSVEERRMDLRLLIHMALLNRARGVGLDFYFDDEAKAPAIDRMLCDEIERARGQNMPVLTGYTFKTFDKEIIARRTASSLERCLPADSQGHLVGFREWDSAVRFVPLYFTGDPALPSLSLRLAGLITGHPEREVAQPHDGLLQFLPPAEEFTVVAFQRLRSDPQQAEILANRFVIAGAEGPGDRFTTPFGELRGAVIHASAVHSMVQNHFIRRVSWWWNFTMIFVFCYMLTALAVGGLKAWKLVLLTAAISAGAFGLAAAMMYLWLVWMDLAYLVLSLWLLLFLLLGLRKLVPPERLRKFGLWRTLFA